MKTISIKSFNDDNEHRLILFLNILIMIIVEIMIILLDNNGIDD